METFKEYLSLIDHTEHRNKTEEIFKWIMNRFPELMPKIAWNQPMFTDHGTFIIGFSISKQHLAVTPEYAGIIRFSKEIIDAGYEHSKMIMRIKWDDAVNYELLEKMIHFNIVDKAKCTTFWR